jgi:hypothetical protein
MMIWDWAITGTVVTVMTQETMTIMVRARLDVVVVPVVLEDDRGALEEQLEDHLVGAHLLVTVEVAASLPGLERVLLS